MRTLSDLGQDLIFLIYFDFVIMINIYSGYIHLLFCLSSVKTRVFVWVTEMVTGNRNNSPSNSLILLYYYLYLI